MQTERRLPNRVEDSSPFSLPDLRRTGCSTVHYEAAASLIALCPATHLPVTYWPAASAPLIAPQRLPSESCRLALRSQLSNFPPVRRLALRLSAVTGVHPLIAIGIFPVTLPARPAIALRTFHAVSGASTRTENWDSRWTDALVVPVIKPLRPGVTTI